MIRLTPVTLTRAAGRLAVVALAACGRDESAFQESKPVSAPKPPTAPAGAELATFGAGCFWCVEAVFQELNGVLSVESGYSGGAAPNPTYEQVCGGATGHAEACQIRYDPAQVRYEDLLEVFWRTHDPTTPNQQGHDVGSQYRSVIFCHTDRQKRLAEEYKTKLDASGAFDRPIVTEIAPFAAFYPAEAYHRDYFRRNPQKSYCQFVIQPKMEKFRKVFKPLLKQEAGR